MKSVIVLMLLVAAMGLVTARPELNVLRAIEVIEEKEVGEPACCNDCSSCRGRTFGECNCKDLVRRCNPHCGDCVRIPTSQGPPWYRCMKMSWEDCHRKCDYAATVFKSIN